MTDPQSPPPYGQPPGAGQPPPYGAPPSYQQPRYGGPPSSQGSAYGGPIPGQAPGDPAPMGLRLVARIIDSILIAAVTLGVLAAVGFHPLATHVVIQDGKSVHEWDIAIYSQRYYKLIATNVILGGIYEVVMIALRGATLGKMAAGVKVVKLADRSLPGFSAALGRWVIPALAEVVFGPLQLLLWISPFFDRTKRNRGWYDMAAGTIAVRSR